MHRNKNLELTVFKRLIENYRNFIKKINILVEFKVTATQMLVNFCLSASVLVEMP